MCIMWAKQGSTNCLKYTTKKYNNVGWLDNAPSLPVVSQLRSKNFPQSKCAWDVRTILSSFGVAKNHLICTVANVRPRKIWILSYKRNCLIYFLNNDQYSIRIYIYSRSNWIIRSRISKTINHRLPLVSSFFLILWSSKIFF